MLYFLEPYKTIKYYIYTKLLCNYRTFHCLILNMKIYACNMRAVNI